MISTRHSSPKRFKVELTFPLSGQRMKKFLSCTTSLRSSNAFNGNKRKKLNVFQVAIVPGGGCLRGSCPKWQLTEVAVVRGGSCPRWQLSKVAFVWVAVVQVAIVLEPRLGWRTPRVDSLKLVNYTRIENAHKIRKKIFVFFLCDCYMYNYYGEKTDTGLCEPLYPPELPIRGETR